MSAVERVLERLERVKRNGAGWICRCPAHEDHSPSLSVSEGEDGRVLLHCHAGCTAEAVLGKLGLELADLFTDPAEPSSPRRIVATYDYVDEAGMLLFQAVRFEPKGFSQRRPDGAGGYVWNLKGTRRVVYRLPLVLSAAKAGYPVWIAEGEKDADALESAGVVATCNPMGAGKWRSEFAESLRGASEAVIVADKDEAGVDHAGTVAASVRGVVARVRIVQAKQGKDAADHLAAGLTVEDFEPVSDDARASLEPFALWLDEFIAARSDAPAALIGDDDEVLLPALGLLILGGRGGKGKTTFTVDAVFHLASGVDWQGFRVGRPLRVLVIENEGPRELFRQKIATKRETWPHEIPGGIAVQTFNWGAFSLADAAQLEQLRGFVQAEKIDLVVGDPLDTLGLEGVGSPENTRVFVELLKAAGLLRSCAFWLLHHPRKEKTADELDELSGAWGGRPDTVLRIDLLEGNRSRLSFPKIRWNRRGKRPARILGFDPETEGFEVLAEEQAEERDYAAEIEELLSDGVWRTPSNIAKKREEGGIGANRKKVEKALSENSEQFVSRPGTSLPGGDPKGTYWGLVRGENQDEQDTCFDPSDGRLVRLLPPIGEQEDEQDRTVLNTGPNKTGGEATT